MMEHEFLNDRAPDGLLDPFPTPNLPGERAAPDTRVEDYLDHFFSPLVGKVPYAERQTLRAEVRGHLESLIAAYEELGSAPEQAVGEALRQFGPPRRLGTQWARTWKAQRRSHDSASVMGATAAGLGWFSLALAGTVAFFVVRAVELGASGFNIGDFEVPLVTTAMPLAAGLLTGIAARGRQSLGTFHAVGLLILLNTLVSTHFSSVAWQETGMSLAFVQLLSWLPVGCLGAALGGWMRRKVEGMREKEWIAA